MAHTATLAFPAVLRESAKAIPAETLQAFRSAFAEAFTAKLASMKDASAGNAAMLRKLRKEAEAGEHDAALRVMLLNSIPVDFFLRTVRGGGEAFNVYGIPKALLAARMLLSASPLWGVSSDACTMRGTIAALLAGKHKEGKKGVASFLDDYMSALGRGGGNYRSGGTQSSSSCHALAALGLLSVPAPGNYHIVPGAEATLAALLGKEGNASHADASEAEEEEYAWG